MQRPNYPSHSRHYSHGQDAGTNLRYPQREFVQLVLHLFVLFLLQSRAAWCKALRLCPVFDDGARSGARSNQKCREVPDQRRLRAAFDRDDEVSCVAAVNLRKVLSSRGLKVQGSALQAAQTFHERRACCHNEFQG